MRFPNVDVNKQTSFTTDELREMARYHAIYAESNLISITDKDSLSAAQQTVFAACASAHASLANYYTAVIRSRAT